MGSDAQEFFLSPIPRDWRITLKFEAWLIGLAKKDRVKQGRRFIHHATYGFWRLTSIAPDVNIPTRAINDDDVQVVKNQLENYLTRHNLSISAIDLVPNGATMVGTATYELLIARVTII